MLHSLEQVKLEMLSMLNEIYPLAFLTMNENSWKKNVLITFKDSLHNMRNFTWGKLNNNNCLSLEIYLKGQEVWKWMYVLLAISLVLAAENNFDSLLYVLSINDYFTGFISLIHSERINKLYLLFRCKRYFAIYLTVNL